MIQKASQTPLRLLVPLALILISNRDALAVIRYWDGSASTYWDNAANWHDPNGVGGTPDANDDAMIVDGAYNPQILSGEIVSCESMEIGGGKTVWQKGGSATTRISGITVGYYYSGEPNSPRTGRYDLDVRARLTTKGGTTVGQISQGTGTFINDRAIHRILVGEVYGSAANLYIGRNSGCTGRYTMSGDNEYDPNDPNSYELSVGGNAYIGYSGSGTFEHLGEADGAESVISGGLFVGYDSGSDGSYTLTGTGNLTVGSHTYVGRKGQGSFTHGGSATHDYVGQLVLGGDPNDPNAIGSGTYVFSGNGAVDPNAGADPNTSSGIKVGCYNGSGRFEWKADTARIYLHGKTMTVGGKGTLAMGYDFALEDLLAGELFEDPNGHLDISAGVLEIIDGATGTLGAGESAVLGSLTVTNGSLALASGASSIRLGKALVLDANS